MNVSRIKSASPGAELNLANDDVEFRFKRYDCCDACLFDQLFVSNYSVVFYVSYSLLLFYNISCLLYTSPCSADDLKRDDRNLQKQEQL